MIDELANEFDQKQLLSLIKIHCKTNKIDLNEEQLVNAIYNLSKIDSLKNKTDKKITGIIEVKS